eukprot:TRINITY_DN34347_c0_g1_i3.p1 TRINITY_DN34347_c0_g1~~TRINITY_DN34347_c0_g1_i3.p1  ORF type:complete len:501 (+),score=116.07 TRINITY_DN34347_c0_g1_i3:55-1557(+)
MAQVTVDWQGRAQDLLDRLQDCGIGKGLNEDDMFGKRTRDVYKTSCSKVIDGLKGVADVLGFGNRQDVMQAMAGVQQNTRNNGKDQDNGNLDRAMLKLVKLLEPGVAFDKRIEVLEHVVALLQVGRMLGMSGYKPQSNGAPSSPPAEKMEVDEPPPKSGPSSADNIKISQYIREIAQLIGLSQEANKASGVPALHDINSRVLGYINDLPANFFTEVMPEKQLSQSERLNLSEIYDGLFAEYKIRRACLVERAKVTMQSFLWSKKVEGNKGLAQETSHIATKHQSELQVEPHVKLQDVYKARYADLASVAQRATSGDKGQFHASVKSVIIGRVPDRGGRPEGREAEAYQEQSYPSSGGGRGQQQGGGRGGGGRDGGRGGGYQQQDGGRGRGGFDGGRGGGYQGRGGGGGGYDNRGGNYQGNQGGGGGYQGGYNQGGYDNSRGGGGGRGGYDGGYGGGRGGYQQNQGSGRVQGGWQGNQGGRVGGGRGGGWRGGRGGRGGRY